MSRKFQRIMSLLLVLTMLLPSVMTFAEEYETGAKADNPSVTVSASEPTSKPKTEEKSEPKPTEATATKQTGDGSGSANDKTASDSADSKDREEQPKAPAGDAAVEKTERPAEEPAKTAGPEKTAEPAKTAEPEKTAEPAETAEPERTAEPAETAEPENTVEPAETAEPENTVEPAESAEPEESPEPEETPEPEELVVKLSSDVRYAFAKDDAIDVSLSIAGGAPEYTVKYQVRLDGSVVKSAEVQLGENTKDTFTYLPKAFGVHKLTATVTDAAGQTAVASVKVPVAEHDTTSAAKQRRKIKDASLTGDWREDILAVARTQLGYHESKRDFIIREDGSKQGYSVYGDWYGLPYEEWCAMFVAYCASYAKINIFPLQSACQRMLDDLTAQGVYHTRTSGYEPQPGDIVFFNWDSEPDPDHVGIVESVTDSEIHTIEGNHGKAVARVDHSRSDSQIMGYASMWELMLQAGVAVEEAEEEEGIAEEEEEEEDPDAWIEEKLRALERQYNSGIMPMAFVVGTIPWSYFTASGLPSRISEAKWREECGEVSRGGYNVDNTGVKYNKFPQYPDDSIHFVNVTVGGVEVVRAGILEPDTGVGDPVYYYMTQKHVDSDANDGSGSHTGSISALLLPEGATFQVNYAVNEYKLSYEIQVDKKKVELSDPSPVKDANGEFVTWEYAIFAGQNPASTNNGGASFAVTIPYGYTAQVFEEREIEDGVFGDQKKLTGNSDINEGYPLGTEPEYEVKGGKVVLKEKFPSARRMSAVFSDVNITQNRHIIVELTKDERDPVFDAHWWLQTANANGRGSTGSGLDRAEKDGNIETEDGWGWNKGVFSKDPRTLKDDETYASHWKKNKTDGTWSLYWIFQTNAPNENYVLNSLELNGVYIDIPFKAQYINSNNKDTENTEGKGKSVTTTVLPDGAVVQLTYYREFNGKRQRVYILEITGARSDITVTGGNLMQYASGAPEYVATVMTGVTTDDANSDTFGYYSQAGTWEAQPKVLIQVQDDKSPANEKTNFGGDPKNHYANLRFKLQTGYESPSYIWEDRMTKEVMESFQGDPDKIKPLDDTAPDKLEAKQIYGPDKDGWYYIRIGEGNEPGGKNGHKMCVLTLTATAMKYMVRYMVGDVTKDELPADDITNAPIDDNVSNMPEFSTDDSSWDDGLDGKVDGVDGISGSHVERYDDNGGNFYDLQSTPTIPVSEAVPITKDGTKTFLYWVLVDNEEHVIYKKGAPIIVKPNETIDLHSVSQDAVSLSSQIGGSDTNYYVLRLKGVWSDTPTDFQFYIRMVWVDEETGESHIMDLVQNVTTSSTALNMENGCLQVTVNTLTGIFTEWFKEHPFYGYDPENFISTIGTWEIYPEDFTSGSAEQGIQNKDAYYRVVVGEDGIARYVVQSEATIILYLKKINGSLPITKTVVGSDAGKDSFEYTLRAELLPEDIDRINRPEGADGYLTKESLKNLLPSGSFLGMEPDEKDAKYKDFTGTDVELHFKRYAESDNPEDWYSTATFTLKGGEATILSVPQGNYTITEAKGDTSFQYKVSVNGSEATNRTITNQVVRVGEVSNPVNFKNEVQPGGCSLNIETTITGANAPAPEATFDYALILAKGSESAVSYEKNDGLSITTSGGTGKKSAGTINFSHAGTYEFLVKETLKNVIGAENNTVSPASSTRSVTVVVENINGKLTVTKITVDGKVYQGAALENAVVPFMHTYKPVIPEAVRVVPEVWKLLRGRSLLPSVFEFVLTDGEGKTVGKATNQAAANNAKGSVLFDPIDFTKEGTYTYTVTEVTDGKEAAFECDTDTITIIYDVKDTDGDGKLEATTRYEGGKDTFENQAFVDYGFGVTKDYNVNKRPGQKWEGNTFKVIATLEQAAGKVKYGGSEVGVGAKAALTLTETEKSKEFNFRFYSEGSYLFKVEEEKGDIPGVSYDGNIYYVTVIVSANGEVLTANLSIAKNGAQQAGDTITFYNTFDNKIDYTVHAKKILQNGRLKGKDFSFVLAKAIPDGVDGISSATQSVSSNDENGDVNFTLRGLEPGHTYTCKLFERNGGQSGIDYDTTEYEVIIKVGDNNGSPYIEWVKYYRYTDSGDKEELPENGVPTFTNTAISQLIVSNTVTGNGADPEKEFKYTFTFDGVDAGREFNYELKSAEATGDEGTGEEDAGEATDDPGNELSDLSEGYSISPLFAQGSAAETGTIKSGQNLQLRHGQSVTIYGLPVGTRYKVTESEYGKYTVSNDAGSGVEASGAIGTGETRVNYINQLDVPVVTIAKTQTANNVTATPLTVRGGSEVTYTLTVENTGKATATNVTITDSVPAGLTVGTINNSGDYQNGIITWTIAELAVGVSKSVSFTVKVPRVEEEESWNNTAKVTWTDETDGNSSNAVTLTAMPVGNLKVSKTVMDDHKVAGKSFNFTVTLGDDTISGIYDGVSFSGGVGSFSLADGGSKTFEDLPAGITYTVEEAVSDGYAAGPVGDTGTIPVNDTAEAKFTNTRITHSLEISKTVLGTLGERDRDFDITVTLSGTATDGTAGNAISGKYGDVTFKAGTADLTLRDSETKTITGLPDGITFTVEEDSYAEDGYSTTVNGDLSNAITDDLDEDKAVSFINANPAGGVAIGKRVVSDLATDEDIEFDFIVSIKDADGNPLTGAYSYGPSKTIRHGGTISLKHDEYIYIQGLPAGAVVAVEEIAVDEFVPKVSPSTGYVTVSSEDEDGNMVFAEITFTNTRKIGGLTVSKTVVDNHKVAGKRFDFTVTLGNDTINETYGGVKFTGGVGKFSLKDGESRIFTDLPANISYRVEEDGASGYAAEYEEATGIIPADDMAEAGITNTRITHSLEIAKSVLGTKGEKDKDFAFSITLSGTAADGTAGASINGVYGDVSFKAGTASFTLRDSESKIITDLPDGIGYSVTEADYSSEGYGTIAYGAASGTLDADEDVTFINTNPAGGVIVRKTVVSDLSADKKKVFTFDVALKDASGNPLPGKYVYEGTGERPSGYLQNGDSILLKADDYIYIQEIPAGTEVTITEKPSVGFTTTVKPANGSVIIVQGEGGGDAELSLIEFINTRKTGSLTVSKTVDGLDGDENTEFEFTVKLDGVSGSYSYTGAAADGTAPADGVISDGDKIQLKHGQSITITDLPVGMSYSVEEMAHSEFDAAVNGIEGRKGTGTIAEDGSVAAFTNTRKQIIDASQIDFVKTQQGKDDAQPTRDDIDVEEDETITYCLAVTNNSDIAAKNLIVTDVIPDGLELIDGSIDGPDTDAKGVVTWKLGDLSGGETKTLSFKAKVPAAVDETAKWENVAQLKYDNMLLSSPGQTVEAIDSNPVVAIIEISNPDETTQPSSSPTGTTKPTEPAATETTKPTEPAATDTAKPTEPAATDTAKPTEPAATDTAKPTEPAATETAKPTQPAATDKPTSGGDQSDDGTPKTGDDSNMRLWIILLVASLLGLSVSLHFLTLSLERRGRRRK